MPRLTFLAVLLGCMIAGCADSQGRRPRSADQGFKASVPAGQQLPVESAELEDLIQRLARDYGFGEYWAARTIYELVTVPELQLKKMRHIKEGLRLILESEERAKLQTTLEPDSYEFTHFVLHDVSWHPGHGGIQLYVWGVGRYEARKVWDPAKEDRSFVMNVFEGRLASGKVAELTTLLKTQRLFSAVVAKRWMVPGESTAEIFIRLTDGQTCRKWLYVSDEHPVLAPIYKYLLTWAEELMTGQPKRQGSFTPDTPMPDDFPMEWQTPTED